MYAVSIRQVCPNGMYDCSTAVQHAKNPTGRTTSLNVGRRWVENHGSLPGFWKAERLHLLEVVSGNILGGGSTFGATSLPLTSFGLNQMKGKTTLETCAYCLQVRAHFSRILYADSAP